RATKPRRARNLQFIRSCDIIMPEGKRIKAVRADSAAYQASIFNHCEATGKVYPIGVSHDVAVKAAIAAIPEGDSTEFDDGQIAETVHCMGKTGKAFRLVVTRRPRGVDLFEPGSDGVRRRPDRRDGPLHGQDRQG